MLAEQPDCPEALRFQCAYLFETGAWADAASLFERLEPLEAARDMTDFDDQMEMAQFYFRFGETLRALDRTTDAVARYERTLELNQTHLPSLEAIGPIYIEMGEWEKADATLRKLLQLTGGQGDPAFLARIYTQLGHVQRHLGDLDKAQKRFNKALELRPNDVPALLGLAGILFERKEWNALLNVYNNVIFHARERADVVDAYLAKGFVLDRKMNLPEKAADHYRKSLNFDASEPRALLRLAELSLRKGTWSEASTLVDQALAVETLDPPLKASLLLARGITRLMAEDLEAARTALLDAGQCDPLVSEALGVTDPTSASEILAVLGERLSSLRT
jgi:tetratricopeptide (TPR) repeat protein